MNFCRKNKNQVVRKTKDHGPMHRVVYGRIILINKKANVVKEIGVQGKEKIISEA